MLEEEHICISNQAAIIAMVAISNIITVLFEAAEAFGLPLESVDFCFFLV